jgi:hypothetical protein
MKVEPCTPCQCSAQELVPLTEWRFASAMGRTRASALEASLFDEIVAQFAREATVAAAWESEKADDREAPKGTTRAKIVLTVCPTTGDLLHNGRDGLRARYCISPKAGECATSRLIGLVSPLLLSSLPSKVTGSDGSEMTKEDVARALQLPSAKIWLEEEQFKVWLKEQQLELGGKFLDVSRWSFNEHEQGNPRLWQWTPEPTRFEVKTGWLTPDHTEFVVEYKKCRSCHIHRWGSS